MRKETEKKEKRLVKLGQRTKNKAGKSSKKNCAKRGQS